VKPTKEQLADPKWWDENADSRDEYCYMDKTDGECFTTWNSNDWVHGFELLAKRPEPEQWKPKAPSLPDIGAEVEIIDNGSLVYGQGESGEVIGHIENCAVVRMSYGLGCFEASYLKIKKTQREELIDLIYMSSEIELDAAAATASIILGKYDLTEKDGE